MRRCDVHEKYSLVPNRRGVGISGGLEKSPKHNKRVGWNSRGGGLEMMQQFNHVFFSFLLKRRLRNLNVLCYVVNEMYCMQ